MSDAPTDQPRRSLRALFQWLRGASASGFTASPVPDSSLPAGFGHYTIERKIGQGGMGMVYAARDGKLHRRVALKTMSTFATDDTARLRFWREARTAASLNHPNICQIFEIGEDRGTLFIAMELLDGVSLAERLKEGPLNAADALATAQGILAALAALHANGVVHRDLKPSNVFLTPHGVKLLDFGLARPAPFGGQDTAPDLTRVGLVVGTPRYMAPEQVVGGAVDARADLFALGAILFEMLAGRPAFTGETVVAILHATVYEEPPALSGPAAVVAIDRVIRRALAKRPEERPASAEAIANLLRDIQPGVDDTPAETRALTRLVVLPFRMLRPDQDTEFLVFSLPDAITASLMGIGSLVLRSTATAARHAGEMPDFKALAADVDVDRVVTGTLLRAGDEVRVVVQLVEAPGATVLASFTVQAPLDDLFRLQDDVARKVADALSLPLGGAESPADSPGDARAYELYLRANNVARQVNRLPEALALYERAVAIDPDFAPAWARLGRCRRLIAKFIEGSPDGRTGAEAAFKRALDLNPRLTVAHKFYAALESDSGHAARAIERLLDEAIRHGNDPELFAGLVHACRYGGLLDESMAADAEARRLDPNITTSIEQTLLMNDDYDRLLALQPRRPVDPDRMMRVAALGLAQRYDEARAQLDLVVNQPGIPSFGLWKAHLTAWLDRRPDQMAANLTALDTLAVFDDPEPIFHVGRHCCDIGAYDLGLPYLERAVARGYYAWLTLQRSRVFEAIRHTPAFQSLLNDAAAGRHCALEAFRRAGGERLLGGPRTIG